MTRTLIFGALVLAAAAGLYLSQIKRERTPPSASAILNMAADAQHDLSRLPMRVLRVSDTEETQIGDRLAKQYSVPGEEMGEEARAEQQYILSVGGQLAARARRPLLWRFHLLPDHALVNAFALPGGHIFIGEGLLDLTTHEDELANVMAHEIEHVDLGHCVERYEIEAKARKFHVKELGELAQLPLSLWQAGYRKDQEFEADREGLFLTVRAGYSPYGQITLMERMRELREEYVIHARTPGQELSQLAIQGLEGYFRTHPQPSERLAVANAIIAQQHWENRREQRKFRIEYEVNTAR